MKDTFHPQFQVQAHVTVALLQFHLIPVHQPILQAQLHHQFHITTRECFKDIDKAQYHVLQMLAQLALAQ